MSSFGIWFSKNNSFLLVEGTEDVGVVTPEGEEENKRKSSSKKGGGGGKSCPFYGCPLLPRDMYFDKEAQVALQTIRSLQQGGEEQQSQQQQAPPLEEKKENENENETEDSVQQQQQEQQQHESITFFYNDAYINTDDSTDQATLTLIGYKGGELHDQINQDRAFVISPYYIHTSSSSMPTPTAPTTKIPTGKSSPYVMRLLGVFDGHAKLGEQVSEYSVQQLPHLLSTKLESILNQSTIDKDQLQQQQQNEQIQNAMSETFVEIDQTAPAEISGGCTASIVLQIDHSIYIANAGDSRSLIATYNKATETTKVVYITREDKPDLPEEKRRVEQAGGLVYIPPPDRAVLGASSRVVYVDTKTGSRNGLAMSRSIGDWDAGKHGVIPNPTVDVLDIHELIQNAKDGRGGDNDVQVFAVSATDGLLDFMEIDDIAQTVAKSLYVDNAPHPLSACESLITTAATSWHQAKEGRYRDDIAIAVSKLTI
jgi:serine/threonine protein phosphatase PrpC